MTTTEPDSLTLGAQARIGSVLRGKYRLDRVLGIGGMAVVYRATHRNQAEFAVKMLHAELSTREDVRSRFLREGYAANSVKHPGAVMVVDDDVAEDGAAFLVMELLLGASIENLWARSGHRMPIRAVLSVADQLLDVLTAAHEKGIVHRDIKPENLFATRDGTLKVLDFGIARVKEVTVGTESANATGTGMVLGTPAFMAPEQAFAKASEVDGQTDLWAVGATLFTLLTGEAVHLGDNATQLLVNAATTRARSVASLVSNVPAGLAQAIDSALSFEKASRWASAFAMRTAILEVSLEMFGDAPSKGALVELLARPDVAERSTHSSPGSTPSTMGSAATPRPTPRAIIRSNAPGPPATGAALTVASEAEPPLLLRSGPSRMVWGLGIGVLVVGALAVGATTLRDHHARETEATPVEVPAAPAAATHMADTRADADATVHRCARGDLAECTAQCSKGEAASCATLGSMYRTGKGVDKDDVRALAFYKQSCDAGNQGGCNGVGVMYENGLGGLPRDEAKAVTLFKQACDAGDGAGCNSLGRMYLRGKGVPRDEARAFALYKQSCDAGFDQGCASAGHEYAKGKVVPKDDARAIALLKQACEGKGPLGCSFLGQMYAKGRGVPKDLARAMALFEQACDAGNPLGCSSLGELYAEGKGAPKDEAHALALYKQACDLGGAGGCTDLGEMYVDGRGVPKDIVQAIALFKKGCPSEGEPGCFAMGLFYERGMGVTADRAKALELYRRSCRADDAWGCAQLKRLKAAQ